MHPSKYPIELVGRAWEQDVLHTLLQRVKQSQGQVAFIVGEAGVGKTRLLVSLANFAQENAFEVVRGECSEQDQDFPYAPIIDGLRTYFSGTTSEELQRIIGPYQQEMVRLLPELAHRIEAAPPPTLLEPEAEKRRLFEVLVLIYQRLTASSLLLIFEDVHWADTNSLEFFQTLTRRIHKLPIMVVISSRVTAPDSNVEKLRTYLERAENAQPIVLQPLAEHEVEDLTQALLQTTNMIHPHLLERLNTLAQGNPLYTEQIVYMLLENRQINLVNGTWMITSVPGTVEIPTSIARTVQQQVERLSDPAKCVLQIAAVAGRQFELNILQQLTTFDEMQLVGLVKELLRKRFFEEVSRDRCAFRHALLRRAIYDGLLIRERQELHQAMLHILEGTTSTLADTHLAELSHHAYQAQAWEAALRYGFQAGDYALSLHSPYAAVEHFRHAIEAANQLGDRSSWELFMQRGKAFDNLGEFQQALDDYQSALNVAERNGNQKAVWQVLIAIALLWSSRDYRHAQAYCNRALQVAEAIEEPRLIGHSLNRLGNWYLNTGQPFEALQYHKQALAVFNELDDLRGKGETLDLLGMASGHVLLLEEQLQYFRSAVEIFRILDDRKSLASSLANLAQSTTDFTLAEEAIDIARQIGWYSGEVYACIVTGYTHSLYGHFTQSLSYMERAQELAWAINHTQWLAGTHVFSGFIYRDMLELETAINQVEQGISLAKAVGSHWFTEMGSGLLAQLYIDTGQLDLAAELLMQHAVPDPPAMQHLMVMMAEAELALAHGDAQAALSVCERLQGVLSLEGESIPSIVFFTVDYLKTQARAMAMLGHPADALERLLHARHNCEHSAQLPALSALWQIEILIGQIAAQHDTPLAEDAFNRARICVDQLAENTPPEFRPRFQQQAAARIEAAQRTGAHPAVRNGNVSKLHSQLTPREMDIVREVAGGKSNQQIADALYITVKTVETHLTRILSKLDMTSRTQVALWAAENNFTPPSK